MNGILLKGFFRRKETKVYLVIISALLILLLLLIGFISYFSSKQNMIFSESSEVVVINDYDIFDKLKKVKNISNIKRILAFRENKNYDIFAEPYYYVNGELINDGAGIDNKVAWAVMEKEGIDDFILVYSDADFDMHLDDDEIVIGLDDFWYDSYDKSFYDEMINKKIGFWYGDINLEFNINNVIRMDESILIISKSKYSELLDENKLFVYTADTKIYKYQTKLKKKLGYLSDSENYISVIVTCYKGDNSNIVSSLYDLLDILNLVCNLVIVIFLIVLVIILKNIINDSKDDMFLNRIIGFNKFQVRLDIFIKIFVTYIISILISIISFVLISLVIKFIFDINLIFIDLSNIFILLIIGGIFIMVISFTFTLNLN